MNTFCNWIFYKGTRSFTTKRAAKFLLLSQIHVDNVKKKKEKRSNKYSYSLQSLIDFHQFMGNFNVQKHMRKRVKMYNPK